MQTRNTEFSNPGNHLGCHTCLSRIEVQTTRNLFVVVDGHYEGNQTWLTWVLSLIHIQNEPRSKIPRLKAYEKIHWIEYHFTWRYKYQSKREGKWGRLYRRCPLPERASIWRLLLDSSRESHRWKWPRGLYCSAIHLQLLWPRKPHQWPVCAWLHSPCVKIREGSQDQAHRLP